MGGVVVGLVMDDGGWMVVGVYVVSVVVVVIRIR